MNVYQENIIDHYKNPRNFGSIENADYMLFEVNTLCGDGVKFYLKLDESKKLINEIKFEGEGCAISQATASMLTEEIKGNTIEEFKTKLNKEFVLDMIGIEVNPSRLKCAMLCVECLRKAGL